MANCCSWDVYFYGKEENVKKLEEFLGRFILRALYTMTSELGITLPEGVQARAILANMDGIEDVSIDGKKYKSLYVNFDAAWNSYDEAMGLLADHFGVGFASCAFEPGNEIASIYGDPNYIFFKENVIVDVNDDNEYGIDYDMYFFTGMPGAISWLQKNGVPVKTASDAYALEFLSIHKFNRSGGYNDEIEGGEEAVDIDDKDGYKWYGMRIMTWNEVLERAKEGTLAGCFFLYDDDSEAQIDDDYNWWDVVRHHENGGQFGEEKKFVEITLPDGKKCNVPKD